MHAYGDAQHGAQRNEVGTYMSVADGSVVGTPVVHDGIDILEGILRLVQTGNEPGGRPCGVCTFVQCVVDLLRQLYRPSLGQLQHGAQILNI